MRSRTLLAYTLIPVLGVASLTLGGCGGTKTTRLGASEVKDLSGKWNDTDAQDVMKKMIPQLLEAGWCKRFAAENKRAPVVKLAPLVVRVDGDDINTDVFMKKLRGALINSGEVDVMDETSAATRADLADQANFSEKAKEAGKELAADFLLKGSINSQNDQADNQQVRTYFINMELTNVQTRKIVWQGDMEPPIKKFVENAKNKF